MAVLIEASAGDRPKKKTAA